MSALATKLANVAPEAVTGTRKGPEGACHGKYPADLDDWTEVHRLRAHPSTWRDAQRIVDDALGITDPIANDKFRYHWNRKCWCWPAELRQR
jgi:hypothetical protein